ncbi:MAG: alkaline phosphatase family protein [Acidimicrobiia bacterium]
MTDPSPRSRRDFLRRAGLVATGAVAAPAALAACSSGRAPTTAPDSIVDHPAHESGIDTVVVVMMENRSFDHFLGWLPDDTAYVDEGRRRHGATFRVDGRQRLAYPDPDGREFRTRPLVTNGLEPDPWRGCTHPVPGHGWNSGRAQLRRGFLGKDTGNDEYAISYYRGEDVPFTRLLAQRFTVFDHWHASLMAGTFPNRQYLHAATSSGRREDPVPLREGIFTSTTIWDRLAAAHVPARYYYVDLPILTLWGPRLYDRISVIDDFFDDAEAGTLPNVVMIDPGFGGPRRSDDHTYADIRIGQRFLREVFRAFTQSKQWERGAFVLLYDEWGGFFDHVPPPVVPDDRNAAISFDDFGQTGFRVPAIVASPRSGRGAVDHTRHDHTSLLRFLEWRFLGAPARGPGGAGRWWLTRRDRFAHNMGAALGTGHPDPDLHFDVDLALAPGGPACLAPAPPATEPGAAVGASGEWELDQHLEALTKQRFPEAQANPWIEPEPGFPTP